MPWLRVAVAGLLGLLLAPGPGGGARPDGAGHGEPHEASALVLDGRGTGFLLTMASAICPRCSRYPRASASPMSAVFLYVLDPALEGTSDERGVATLRASQHAHGTGFAVALDDGQALVLD